MAEGEGVRAEKARTRRVLGIALITAFAVILISAGVTFGRIATGKPLGHVPPVAAVAAAVLLPIVLIWGARASWNASDELDRADTLKAGTAGFYAFVCLSLAWMFLEQGDFLPEPNALALFFASNLAFAATYFWVRLRRHYSG